MDFYGAFVVVLLWVDEKKKIIVMIIVFVLMGTGNFQMRLKKKGMWVGFFYAGIDVHSFDVHYYYCTR